MVEWHDDPKTEIVPVVPLRDSVLLPKSIVPVLIGRSKSLAAVEHAQEEKTRVFWLLLPDASSITWSGAQFFWLM